MTDPQDPYARPDASQQPPGPQQPSPPFPADPGYGFTPQGQPAWGAGPQAPYGIDPQTGQAYSDKSRIVAGILQLFLGSFGAGRWYTGSYGMAVAQLLTCGGLGIWALIDAIYMLVGSAKDPLGRPLRP